MRTIFPIAVVLSLAAAAMLINLAGLGAVLGPNPAAGVSGADQLNASGQDSPASEDGSLEGSASSADDGDIVGLIISGIAGIVDGAAFVVLLPWQLQSLGFPYFFAWPVGMLGQTIVGWGLFQLATNRRWV
jgi:hypothetical protein